MHQWEGQEKGMDAEWCVCETEIWLIDRAEKGEAQNLSRLMSDALGTWQIKPVFTVCRTSAVSSQWGGVSVTTADDSSCLH